MENYMKRASDFRKGARDALKGKWGIAVLAGIITSMLGGSNSYYGALNLNFDIPSDIPSGSGEQMLEGLSFESLFANIPTEVLAFLGAFLGFIVIAGLIFGTAFFILGSIINVGYSSFSLDLVDGKRGEIGTLFAYFKHWKVCVLSNLLRALYVFLWSLLFVIPGIIAAYSYMMVPYIVADNPDISPSEALRRSKSMMRGNRWRLFCLEISFIGWAILSLLTLGIGCLWLTPYVETSLAEFYREISGTRPKKVFDDPMLDFAFEG